MTIQRILILDNDKKFIQSVKQCLKKTEFTPVTEEELQVDFQKTDPSVSLSLILLDTKSENKFKKLYNNDKTPVVHMSENAEQEVHECNKKGCYGFYDKKSDLSLLVYIIRFALRLYEQENRHKSLLYTNNSIMLLIDPDNGEIKEANNEACRFY